MPSGSTPGPKCPICRKPTDTAYRPFCSKRCADVDLGRWMSDRYVVEGEDGDALGELPIADPDTNSYDDR